VVSDELERWFSAHGDKTIAGLLEFFGHKSFALLFVILMAPTALPLPTGGVTYVFEATAILLAAQLVLGREHVWLPQRWRRIRFGGDKDRFARNLIKLIRWLERFSRPRMRFLFGRRASNIAFGLLVMVGSLAAMLAPPFAGLDTLPSLGVVLLSLGVLLEDAYVAIAGLILGAAGIAVEILLGAAAIRGIEELTSAKRP